MYLRWVVAHSDEYCHGNFITAYGITGGGEVINAVLSVRLQEMFNALGQIFSVSRTALLIIDNHGFDIALRQRCHRGHEVIAFTKDPRGADNVVPRRSLRGGITGSFRCSVG